MHSLDAFSVPAAREKGLHARVSREGLPALSPRRTSPASPATVRDAAPPHRWQDGRTSMAPTSRTSVATCALREDDTDIAAPTDWGDLATLVRRMPSHEFSSLLVDVVPVLHGKKAPFLTPPAAKSSQDTASAVTWCTQLSLDRWHCLVRLSQAWPGPISAAVHVPWPLGTAAAAEVECQLASAVQSLGPDHSVTVSTLYAPACKAGRPAAPILGVAARTAEDSDSETPEVLMRLAGAERQGEEGPPDESTYAAFYPINALRNVAIAQARTAMVAVADADMVPSEGLQEAIVAALEAWDAGEGRSGADGGFPVAVVPTFETGQVTEHEDRRSQQDASTSARGLEGYPRTREELRASGACMFHCGPSVADSGALDQGTWFKAKGAIFEVPYAEGFEPLMAGRKDEMPRFADDFRGYGLNKVQQAWHVASTGGRFLAVTGGFAVTRPHARSGAFRRVFGAGADPRNKLRIAALYERWKMETAALGPVAVARLSRMDDSTSAQLLSSLPQASLDVEPACLTRAACPPVSADWDVREASGAAEDATRRSEYILYNSEWRSALDRAFLGGQGAPPVSFVTHCPVASFPTVAARLASQWDGSASIAVFVPAPKSSPEGRAMARWLREQFAHLPDDHRIRATPVYGDRFAEAGMRALAAMGLDSISSPSRQHTYADAYPAGALLNAAIAAAESDAVLVADASLRPCAGLAGTLAASLGAAAQAGEGQPAGSEAGAGAGLGASLGGAADVEDAKSRLERALRGTSADASPSTTARVCRVALVPIIAVEGGCEPTTKAGAVGLVRKHIQAQRGGALRWPFRGDSLLARWANRSRSDFPARAPDLFDAVAIAGPRSCLPRFDERFRGSAGVSRAQFARHVMDSGVPVDVCGSGFLTSSAWDAERDVWDEIDPSGTRDVALAALYRDFTTALAVARATCRELS